MKQKKILVICPYPEKVAPSQRLKYEQYFPYFEKEAYSIAVSPFISDSFWKVIYKEGNFFKKLFYTLQGYGRRINDLFRLSKHDIVYVHLWATPIGPPLYEWLLRKLANKVVYDIDDLVYLKNMESKAHPLVTYIKGTQKPIYLMKHADHVITCTPYLDKFVRNYNHNTTDISSTIDTKRYKPKTEYAVQDKFTIGWSGSHSTSKYLHLLDDVFQELAKEHDFKLLVMGDASFRLPGVNVEALSWKEEYEIEVISRFDVGVYPLPDEEWVYGKSGLKALQYMALGIPTIATGLGTIFRIITDGENGFLVNSPGDWKKRLIELIHAESLRRNIGQNAAQTVQDRYSVNANKDIYLSILNQLTSS